MSITLYSKFRFSCHKGLKCFTRCCRNVNIFLTPYDVLRMKNRTGVQSDEFLKKYTKALVSSSFSLPVVLLKMKDDEDKSCPFLTNGGCSIYEDRPWSCRMYPLDKDIEDDEYKLIVGEDFCLGLKEGKEWIVEDWFEDQGLIPYDTYNQLFNQIVNAESSWGNKVPDKSVIDMFYMTCYNIDKFRGFVFNSSFLNLFEVDEGLKERIRVDDPELLKFGFKWLRFGLLGEKNLLIKESALKKKKK